MRLHHFVLVSLTLLAACYSGAEAQPTQPRSLAGTEIDGELRTERGMFVFDEQARMAFDYFLTAEDEVSRPELDAWVHTELTRRLPDAADDGLAAWNAYVEYRSAAAATLADDTTLDAAEQRLAALISEHLGDYPIAAREQADNTRAFALKRAAALAGEARGLALAGLAAGSEPADAFLVGRRAAELARLTSADELHAVRTQHFGAEAADRLAALDARRAAWNARLAAFQTARAALLVDFAGTQAQRATAEAELAAQHFSSTELPRVHALMRITAD
ncbi:MAG TPA: lipase secretion chaperone [Nannocystis sp.]